MIGHDTIVGGHILRASTPPMPTHEDRVRTMRAVLMRVLLPNARPTCTAAGHCHGWATTWCHGCGSVSPCASVDCPSCGECDATMREARQRRARALVWLEDGGNVLIPDGPPSHTWAIHDRAGGFIGMADSGTVEGAFLAWCELAGIAPDEWRAAVVLRL